MTGTGFYQQKSIRPGGLALVIALHAAAFAGLVLVKTDVVRVEHLGTDVFNVFEPPPPEPEPEPQPRVDQPHAPSVIETVPPIVDVPTRRPTVSDPPLPPLPPTTEVGDRIVVAEAAPDLPPPPPVRVEARFDPRYAADQQPPYPAREEAAQREGSVRVRLRIGADGRVKAIERLTATSDAFWRATERHALARWRFRPATLDGRPVETTLTMSVFFRIEA